VELDAEQHRRQCAEEHDEPELCGPNRCALGDPPTHEPEGTGSGERTARHRRQLHTCAFAAGDEDPPGHGACERGDGQ
jgi:hypothetical protein